MACTNGSLRIPKSASILILYFLLRSQLRYEIKEPSSPVFSSLNQLSNTEKSVQAYYLTTEYYAINGQSCQPNIPTVTMTDIREVKESLIGKQLHVVPTPAVVLDRAVVQRNCDQLLEACHFAQVKFRPHIKTHKVRCSLDCPVFLFYT